ncbi:hypothetical protein EYF80_014717 [Liparis tanakae]|uniref:Uncharacterized protein n=1 Tax=Liparis tanakae TaxID=230148 RepID=A0A4Z2IC37_9TELE|nr:hypothetical protein EYF80_014717 [Liparis tanakae]
MRSPTPHPPSPIPHTCTPTPGRTQDLHPPAPIEVCDNQNQPPKPNQTPACPLPASHSSSL